MKLTFRFLFAAIMFCMFVPLNKPGQYCVKGEEELVYSLISWSLEIKYHWLQNIPFHVGFLVFAEILVITFLRSLHSLRLNAIDLQRVLFVPSATTCCVRMNLTTKILWGGLGLIVLLLWFSFFYMVRPFTPSPLSSGERIPFQCSR